MTNEEKQVSDWMKAFNQEVPDKPTMPSLEVRKLRARLQWEEGVKELIYALGLAVQLRDKVTGETILIGERYAVEFVEHVVPDLTEIADGCADLMVVTLGTKAACGLSLKNWFNLAGQMYDPIFNEVMRSNWTKLWTHDEACQRAGVQIGVPDEIPTRVLLSTADRDYWAYYMSKEYRCWLVTDSDGKVIKSPSYSPANLQPFV